jgi:hypothetical protein
MSELVLSRHARDRMVEFGLGLDVVEELVHRPDRTHTDAVGERLCVADAHPSWAAVVGDDGVVITVLRRTAERWRHEPLPTVRPLSTTSTAAPAVPEVAAAVAPSRPRSRPARTPRASGGVVSIRADPAAMAVALRLAGGDVRRLQPNRDGSVTVLNHPRPARA